MKLNEIYQGDALQVLRTFDNELIDCCVTSPPYWALRDYGIEGQLGNEPTFELYIERLCDVFDEVKRVLKKEGTCWVNIGDTYFGGCGGPSSWERKSRNIEWREKSERNPHRRDKGYPSKCLTLVPFRFAIEMINRGWILRNVIIWHKPNCVPESVKDRFTTNFEYLFFFVKQKKYYFEQQFELMKESSLERLKRKFNPNKEYSKMSVKSQQEYQNRFKENTIRYRHGGKTDVDRIYNKVNKRSIWTISLKPFHGAHFAVYPKDLIEIPIKAGCSINGIVLDPFMGSGTTAIVAKKQNKNYLGIELNPEYIKIANERIKKEFPNKLVEEFI
jgi:DNA modification methylase